MKPTRGAGGKICPNCEDRFQVVPLQRGRRLDHLQISPWMISNRDLSSFLGGWDRGADRRDRFFWAAVGGDVDPLPDSPHLDPRTPPPISLTLPRFLLLSTKTCWPLFHNHLPGGGGARSRRRPVRWVGGHCTWFSHPALRVPRGGADRIIFDWGSSRSRACPPPFESKTDARE